jgi:hypothetical protein
VKGRGGFHAFKQISTARRHVTGIRKAMCICYLWLKFKPGVVPKRSINKKEGKASRNYSRDSFLPSPKFRSFNNTVIIIEDDSSPPVDPVSSSARNLSTNS